MCLDVYQDSQYKHLQLLRQLNTVLIFLLENISFSVVTICDWYSQINHMKSLCVATSEFTQKLYCLYFRLRNAMCFNCYHENPTENFNIFRLQPGRPDPELGLSQCSQYAGALVLDNAHLFERNLSHDAISFL